MIKEDVIIDDMRVAFHRIWKRMSERRMVIDWLIDRLILFFNEGGGGHTHKQERERYLLESFPLTNSSNVFGSLSRVTNDLKKREREEKEWFNNWLKFIHWIFIIENVYNVRCVCEWILPGCIECFPVAISAPSTFSLASLSNQDRLTNLWNEATSSTFCKK